MKFPENFLWGGASSEFQFEGASTEGHKGRTGAEVPPAKKYTQVRQKSENYVPRKSSIELPEQCFY